MHYSFKKHKLSKASDGTKLTPQVIVKYCRGLGLARLSFTAGRDVEWYIQFGKDVLVSLRIRHMLALQLTCSVPRCPPK